MSHSRRPAPPLDAANLERIALRYVERYATTRAKLHAYLTRKVAERGACEPLPPIEDLVGRIAALGYVDDLSYARSKAEAMARRGLGARRVGAALRHAGIEEDDSAQIRPEIDSRAIDSALTFARRRRIGPYGDDVPDRAGREKQLAKMVRAGHDFALSRTIVALEPGDEVDFLSDPK